MQAIRVATASGDETSSPHTGDTPTDYAHDTLAGCVGSSKEAHNIVDALMMSMVLETAGLRVQWCSRVGERLRARCHPEIWCSETAVLT